MVRRWLRPAALVFGISVLSSLPLPAQQRGIRDTLLLRRYHDTLARLRDTLDAVSAATWELNRDLGTAGNETVLARAQRLRERCQGAAVALPAAARAFPASLERPIRRLRDVLEVQCVRGLISDGSGSRPDSLRAWGPYRTRRIDDAIRRYDAAAGRFAAAAGVKLEPKLPAR